jgi:uncharacterized protein YjbJ (UPF0337 family)
MARSAYLEGIGRRPPTSLRAEVRWTRTGAAINVELRRVEPQGLSQRIPIETHSSRKAQMNKDQVKGRAKIVAGKIEKNVGRAVGSTKTEAKGVVKEVEGKFQKIVGDARNASNDKSSSF